MSAPSKVELEQAIAPLIPGFEADGLRVEVATIEQITVTINFHTSAATCRECLLPQDHLEALLLQSFMAKGIDDIKFVRVVLIDDQEKTGK